MVEFSFHPPIQFHLTIPFRRSFNPLLAVRKLSLYNAIEKMWASVSFKSSRSCETRTFCCSSLTQQGRKFLLNQRVETCHKPNPFKLCYKGLMITFCWQYFRQFYDFWRVKMSLSTGQKNTVRASSLVEKSWMLETNKL